MACQRFAAAITAHALGAPLAAEAAAHLAVCPACRLEFDVERRLLATIDEALADVAATAPSAHFLSRLRAHLQVASQQWAWRQLLMPAAAAALTLLAVALIVPRVSREQSGSDQRHASSTRLAQGPLMASARSPIADANATVRAVAAPRARRGHHVRAAAPIDPAAPPQILVPKRERAAVGRLFASVRMGRPEVVSMILRLRRGETTTDAEAVTIEPLRIDPVVVSELPVAAAILDK